MQIEEALGQYPRIKLTRDSTPLQYLPHLSRQLGVKVTIKRDDLTDLALGGDKPRKLEYELAQARDAGADMLVTCGSSQSNHTRLTAAAARKSGLDIAVVISRDEWLAVQGNLLTIYLMGAQVQVVDTPDHWDLEGRALALCRKLEENGRRPHYIPVSGTTPHSCLGYVRAGLEIVEQLAAGDIRPDAIYTPFGTGGIFTAILLALREKGIGCPVIGISVNRDRAQCHTYLERWWSALNELLHRDPGRARGPFEITDQFIGREYGDPTEEALDAILLMAQTEGILLDPVYSGKMMAGFLAHCSEKRWTKEHSVMLLHSGGVPALFAYHAQIEAHLRKRGIFEDFV